MEISDEAKKIGLICCVIVPYSLIGALLVLYIECDFEQEQRQEYNREFNNFIKNFQNETTRNEFLQILYSHGNMTSYGFIYKPTRWNFLGSLYFVVTIITTIGYGSYTPNTIAGKAFVLIYGIIGCPLGNLFFNQVLERNITYTSTFLRWANAKRCGTEKQVGTGVREWKPNIYWVVLTLTLVTFFMVVFGILIYSPQENWSSFETFYFCFVTFTTLGFGDYVPFQKEDYFARDFYLAVNFIILICGCSLAYSTVNVLSIIMRSCLSDMLVWIRMHCRRKPTADEQFKRFAKGQSTRRRSTIALPRFRKQKIPDIRVDEYVDRSRTPSSASLISMNAFIRAQAPLRMMEKQLYDSSEAASEPHEPDVPVATVGRFIPGTIGPMAMLSYQLGER